MLQCLSLVQEAPPWWRRLLTRQFPKGPSVTPWNRRFRQQRSLVKNLLLSDVSKHLHGWTEGKCDKKRWRNNRENHNLKYIVKQSPFEIYKDKLQLKSEHQEHPEHGYNCNIRDNLRGGSPGLRTNSKSRSQSLEKEWRCSESKTLELQSDISSQWWFGAMSFSPYNAEGHYQMNLPEHLTPPPHTVRWLPSWNVSATWTSS